MEKSDLACQFFEKLGEGCGQFITRMIENQMDSELIEVFNRYAGQLSQGEMDRDRFYASLLIIGYLVRAFEEQGEGTAAEACPKPADAKIH